MLCYLMYETILFQTKFSAISELEIARIRIVQCVELYGARTQTF